MKKYFELIDCLLLSYLGGFLDGYSLLFRGNKFTCMQTGNIIYFAIVWPISIKILQHKIGYKTALEYFVLWIVTAICIATDNLLTYPNFMMSFWLILIIVISETQEDSKT